MKATPCLEPSEVNEPDGVVWVEIPIPPDLDTPANDAIQTNGEDYIHRIDDQH